MSRKNWQHEVKAYRYFVILVLAFFVVFPSQAGAQGVRPELRAFWADGFSEGFKTPEQVDTLLQRLHAAHCNAIFAQMRKGGDAYYASHYEPWAKDDPDHFDALADLIAKAHAMNPPIAVHAWINTCAVGGNGKNPFNIVHLHPDWLSLNPQGVDFDGEATKIDPGNPDAAEWTFRIYLDVARHYDVDGIHFDFVRYGGKEWGYNPVSVARFQQQYGKQPGIQRIAGRDLPAPDDPIWKQWRRDQVTNLVRKVYVHAAQVNPKLIVSAAVITWADAPHTEAEWFTKSAAMNRTMQDWRGWLEEGIIDLACPMTYFQADDHADWQRHWSEYIKQHQYKRAATIAVGTWFNTIGQSLDFIQDARRPSASGKRPYGVMLYCYSGTNADDNKNARGKRAELQYQPAFYTALSTGVSPAVGSETAATDVGRRTGPAPKFTGDPAQAGSAEAPATRGNTASRGAPARGGKPNASAGSVGALLAAPRTPLQAAPFPTDAPLPPMPWKTRPRSGDLKGFVLTPELNPIDGATVTVKRHGKTWTHRTDGTGFYAFVDLPPGDIVVTLSAPGYEQQQAKATVAAGKVTTVPFTLGSASVPLSPSLAVLQHALPELGATEKDLPVRLQNLIVRIGTDTFPGNLYVQDRQGVLMRVRLANPPLLPFQPGDVVSVNGTLLSVDGETTIDHAVARLTDILPMSALPASKVVTEADLKSGDLPRCACARIQGFVTKASADSLTLEAEGTQIVVPLAGRKEFGVEATGLDAALPARGARVLVEGVLTATGGLQDSKAPPFRLYLYEGSNVKMLAPPSALWKTPILIGVASCCFVLLALPIARKQRLARRRERS